MRTFFFVLLGAFYFACTSSSGGETKCDTAPLGCASGDVKACVTTDSSGACTSMAYSFGGKEYACAACGDCTQAAGEIARACTAAPPDAGPLPDVAAPDATPPPDAAAHDAAPPIDAAVPDAGADANDASTCGTPPVLHPEAKPGVYCPFTSGGAMTCAAGEQCCEPPASAATASTCQAAGTACPAAGSSVWQCEDAIDCGGATPVCCGVGAVTLDPACGFRRGTGFTGSHCAASCGASEVIVCETQAECPLGKTCTPFKTQGLGLGACL